MSFCYLFYSTTKASLALGLLLACNHAYSLVDPAPLVLLGGCIMVGFKLWSIRVRSIDPFLTSQGFVWTLLTSFSVTPPHREVVIASSESRMTGKTSTSESRVTARTSKESQKSDDSSTSSSTEAVVDGKEKSSKHLKHD